MLGLLIREGMTLIAIGLAIGLAGSYLVARAMQGELYGVGSIDPLVLGAVAIVLPATALLACCAPSDARRLHGGFALRVMKRKARRFFALRVPKAACPLRRNPI